MSLTRRQFIRNLHKPDPMLVTPLRRVPVVAVPKAVVENCDRLIRHAVA